MDDLISRQAAIEVIDAVFPVDPMKSEYAQGIACGAALAKTYVEQLPSAQQWISCEKELPDVEQPVRISVHGRVFDAVYKGLSSDQEPIWLSHGCVYWADEVSRWMPLPEPFEGGNR